MKAILTIAPLTLFTQLAQAVEETTTKAGPPTEIFFVGLVFLAAIGGIAGFFWYLKRSNDKEEAAKKQ